MTHVLNDSPSLPASDQLVDPGDSQDVQFQQSYGCIFTVLFRRSMCDNNGLLRPELSVKLDTSNEVGCLLACLGT